MVSRAASCACGALSVTVEAEPVMVGACNCTQCQKRTGSAFGVMALFPKDAVKVSGTSKLFTRSADSGNKVDCNFCPECGTTVFVELGVLPGTRGVAVGCFADPSFPSPAIVFWAEHRHQWVQFPKDLPTHQRAGGAS
jgi:hypothetical protein